MAFSRPNKLNAEARSAHKGESASDVPGLTEAVASQPGSLEFSAPLENAVALEAPRTLARAPLSPVVAASHNRQAVPQPVVQPLEVETVSALEAPIAVDGSDRPTHVPPAAVVDRQVDRQADVPAPSTGAATIPLLEERLVIDRHRRKVGEVVVRKEVETHIIEVPIRREKLIVEQISPTYKQLAVVDLGKAQAQTNSPFEAARSQTASAKFTSANAAIEFIEAIAADSNSKMAAIQISIVLVDED